MTKKDLINEKKQYLIQETTKYCQACLDEEYENLCQKLIEKMSRKQEVPFLRGDADIWAAAVVYAIGSINFLFDQSFQPYQSADDIADYFEVKKKTVAQKASLIRDMFKMQTWDAEFSTQTMQDSNPFSQFEITDDGFIMPKINLNRPKGNFVEKYKRYRAISKEMNCHFMENLASKEMMEEAAKLLGIYDGSGGPFIFEDEREMDMLSDFLIYSLNNPAEQFKNHFDTPEQIEILKAIFDSYLSLFEIKDIDLDEAAIFLADILNPGRSVKLIDLGLSQSLSLFEKRPLLFTRILPFSDFAMTSGCSHLFDPTIKNYLLKELKKKRKKSRLVKRIPDEEARKFIVFFHLYRSDGLEVQYQ